MRTCRLIVLTLAVAVNGCAHRCVVLPDSGAEDYREATQALARRTATVTMRTGQVFRWRDVRIAPDTIRGVVLNGGVVQGYPTIPTQQVTVIKSTSRGRGAWEGVGKGLGIGAVLGAVLVAVIPAPCDVCSNDIGYGAFFFGLLGAEVGALIGVIVGSRVEVQIR